MEKLPQWLQDLWEINPSIARKAEKDLLDKSTISNNPIKINEDLILKLGFTKHKSLILDSYSINISKTPLEYKILSVNIEQGNQYIHIRCGDMDKPREEDSIITLFNSDYDGDMYVHTIQNIYYALCHKYLVL